MLQQIQLSLERFFFSKMNDMEIWSLFRHNLSLLLLVASMHYYSWALKFTLELPDITVEVFFNRFEDLKQQQYECNP